MSSFVQRKYWSFSVRRAVPALVAILVFFSWLPGLAMAAGEDGPVSQRWGFLVGYGMSHPGNGKSKTWVETIDLIPRYERELTNDLGSSWYRGRLSLLVELPIHLVVDPAESPMFGLNILASWNFAVRGSWQPYFFGGGGPVYTDAEIEGLGARLNGNYQAGGGLRYRISKGRQLLFEYRFHHVSNGNTEQPNCSINSNKFLVGVTF